MGHPKNYREPLFYYLIFFVIEPTQGIGISNPSKVAGGAVAGVIIVVVLLLVMLSTVILGVVWFVRKKKKHPLTYTTFE